MANKLNAFLASVPANGLPSPTSHKSMTFGEADISPKSLPSLTIPQDDDECTDKRVQPTTPQPPGHRNKAPTTPWMSSSNANANQLRINTQRFGIGRDFHLAGPNDDASNQEEADTRMPDPTKQNLPHPSTPVKVTSSMKAAQRSAYERRKSQDELEAGPLKRLSNSTHHRRISTDTAMFSKMLKRQPHEDIDTTVLEHFAHLPVPTVSRPEQKNNQLDDDNNSTGSDSIAVDPVEILSVFKRGETISVAFALEILKQATNLLSLEPNVLSARAPFTVVGDLHGQFSDLVEIFTVHGMPSPQNPFLFLGDYVDRGISSCEIILILLAFKIASPSHVHLLRGNHECRSLSTFYGFRAECVKKYGLVVYNRMVKCFESLPLAAKVETSYGTFLAVHGGLSPTIEYIDEINHRVNRFMEPEPTGALCDLLWADPAKEAQGQSEPWAPNSVRGCSFTFNEQVCREFLERNNLVAIIRAHELEEDGFREHFQPSGKNETDSENSDVQEEEEDVNAAVARMPPVITVFSAPEYCNTNQNMGATLVIPWTKNPGDRLLEYRQHKRSAQREVEFKGPSEEDSVKRFLRDQLPFLPVDFYDLVHVCRQLRATLDVAASVMTPMPSALNLLKDQASEHSNVDQERPEERQSEHDSSSTEDEQQPEVKSSHLTHEGGPSYQPRRRASTGSGIRLCPGFVRFCEKYLGLHFSSVIAARPDNARQTEKRRSIDDIQVGTTSSPPLVGLSAPQTVIQASDVEVVPLSSAISAAPRVDAAVAAATKNRLDIFTTTQWSALRLYFALLDVNGNGVLMDESFIVLLTEQDSDAYATQEELGLLLEVLDSNGDGLITEHDFLQFAYRAFLRWKKESTPSLTK
ncbi:hypothetical protein Poli38472_006810 [Pythium oligandrum]|uniref:Serine/threonine-protein phosphatase n=1 Tax=Pythium oligandrum TaxID=41045 RepID=A0A8K1C5H1_PYTOL|nr:hypothetical protein Poli38472_006810 [Pythium oligandrum]|eukprot:TMW56800.1 hypothetical protein Poli38472_006810 [Pythium oligandrum]